MTKRKSGAKAGAKERPAIQLKKKRVEELAAASKKYPVVALLNIRALPDRILQSAKKKLRGKAEFAVAKNSVISRALEKAGKSALAQKLDFPTALVFTSLTPYELYKFFKQNKVKVAAKPGQVAPFDIVVPEGETDLMPGPALSELKGAGINAQIKGGKIVVAKDSVVAKKGTKISDTVCKALQKLGIMPFEAQVNMVAAYDGKFLYTSEILDIDEAKLMEGLLACLSDAFNLSYNSSFPTSQNIEALLSFAISQARSLAINGGLYSDASAGILLAQAAALGQALSGKVGSLDSKPADAGASTAAAAEQKTEENKTQ
ncbi:MAG: 50S ribosomal protein L10 [Candidatus Micrarchaeota archaeon]|nr:50S ribosomal protein L10 [Candidatus Micrarchaeota archaeon]